MGQYAVKELYYTLQGEGAQVGRAAVFCRFAGCNLWSGRARDRAAVVCRFCDTEFVGTDGPGGGRYADPEALAAAARAAWDRGVSGGQPSGVVGDDRLTRARPLVVCTGGEPLLQLDADTVEAFHSRGFEVAVETNGTQSAPPGLGWVCVSPKAGVPLRLTAGDELKLVYPQAEPGAAPEHYAGLAFRHFFLHSLDDERREENTRRAIGYCFAHPQWRLSVQTHKLVVLP